MSATLPGFAPAKPPRLVLRAPVAAETELHEAVASALDTLLMRPAQWGTYPAGSVPLPPQFAAKLQRMGLKRGWPDLLLFYRGRCFGIELKREGSGRLSQTRMVRRANGSLRVLDGQEEVFDRLGAAGMTIAVCTSVPEVVAQCRAWGLPVRGAVAA